MYIISIAFKIHNQMCIVLTPINIVVFHIAICCENALLQQLFSHFMIMDFTEYECSTLY